MTRRKFRITLTTCMTLLLAVPAFQLPAATDIRVITEDTLKTANTSVLSQVQALKDQNSDLESFLSGLNDATYAKAVFAKIRANDSAGLLSLVKQKMSRTNVTVTELKPDFKLTINSCKSGSCTTTCISSDGSCFGGKRFSRVTVTP